MTGTFVCQCLRVPSEQFPHFEHLAVVGAPLDPSGSLASWTETSNPAALPKLSMPCFLEVGLFAFLYCINLIKNAKLWMWDNT